MKTSVSLSEHILKALDDYAGIGNRSDFIERALAFYFVYLQRQKRNVKDLEVLNKRFEALNADAADILDYQEPV